MAIRTLEQFEAELTTDLKWRIEEMFLWERTVGRSRDLERSGLLRGGLALLYAHWEGYVKGAGTSYLEYVSRQGLKLGQLRPELAAVALRSKLLVLASEKSTQRHTEAVELLRSQDTLPANVPYDSATIRTYSNLNFETFVAIMHSLGCDADRHEAFSWHIDKRLVSWRNAIAHGREQHVTLAEWVEARNVVETILKDIRTQLSNSAALRTYLIGRTAISLSEATLPQSRSSSRP